mmetsp:Transcript_5018/g.7666  ORF Transcript_5018/g.7666 Transcript_5018/m.7666 type:complete len:462 (+) Transcript_5018:83-1468(+)|eukprot:CAMPEP_0185018634 /NCGR_PEP_ID=MMETSP1103-20130426/1292_1 /TAXON_ID=36769 /ORGANISM="Paraphysomonas bandaiensis, Strain Caron Lab Isolate" /LENGTH=461 /DNA_ID=CAMNT_0027548507 /DNA_START=36 /DNA_END=1421 /DNA_ORIENTATION=-
MFTRDADKTSTIRGLSSDAHTARLLKTDDEDEPHKTRRASSVYSQYTDPDVPLEPVLLNEASSISCYMNLTNTIIGSGVLGLPYAVAHSGSILGVALVFLSAVCGIFSLHLLSICAVKVPPPSSFYSVTEASVPQLTFLIDLAVAVQCFGVCASYLIVIGGLMPDVMENFDVDGFWLNRQPWIILGFAVVAPLSCFHKLDALKYTSGVSVLFVLFLMFLVLFYAIPGDGLHPCDLDDDDDGDCVGDRPLISITNQTMRVFSIFVFAFSCQTNIFAVVNEIRNPSQQRYDNVAASSIFTALTIYTIVAIAGFFTYGDSVDSNILISYPKTHLTSVARVFVSLLVAFSFPLLCHPGRNSILGLWRGCDRDEDAWIKYNKMRYIIVTVGLLAGSFFTAMTVKDLGIIFALVGATGATMISFILPGAAYYNMHRHQGPEWKRYGALVLCGLGCVIMPVCLVFIFI